MFWTDNPVRDADMYFAKKDAERLLWLQGNADCQWCGKTITSEDAVVWDRRYPMQSCLCLDCKRRMLAVMETAKNNESDEAYTAYRFLEDILDDMTTATPHDENKEG